MTNAKVGEIQPERVAWRSTNPTSGGGDAYVVVTPARNEQETIGLTIASMAAQTHQPLRWVVVDDGSSDRTGAILDEAAQLYSWLTVLHRPDRGYRKQGGGVVDAFYDGYDLIKTEPWFFLIKFDADLSFEPNYFERCLAKFDVDQKLGIGGGLICQEVDGDLHCESPGDPAFHVRGATKIYRRECWDAIGGLVRAPGWDTIDELKANMLGWTTRSFADVRLKHHRFTGTVDGTWKNHAKFGRANYISGYHPLFMLAKCLKRSVSPPYAIGAIALAWGYIASILRRVPRTADGDLISYVRREQLMRLRGQPSLWDRTIGSELTK